MKLTSGTIWLALLALLAGCGSSSKGAHTYSISGTVSGATAAGVRVVLIGAATVSTSTDGSGNYSFSGLSNGVYTVAPSKSGFTFTPASIAVTVSGADVTGRNFTGTAEGNTYSISGTVSGATASGVTVTLTGSATASTSTDGSGNYSFSGLPNGVYIVTPSESGYTFSPMSSVVTVNGANVTGRNFTVTAAPNTYSISGTVSGATAAGVRVALTGAAAASTSTDGSGNYSFSGLLNGDYTITPDKSGYTFSPASIPVTVSDANLTGQNFTSTAAPNTYSISGTVSGATAAGVTLALTGAATASTSTDGNGAYSFSGLSNGGYTVTPSESGYTFSPASITVTVSGADVTGRNFTATANNVMPVTVNGSLCSSNSYFNKPCVSVTICEPGTSNCQEITDILLDTGSFGLRIFKQLVSVSLTSESIDGALGECQVFADGSSEWGPVEVASVILGNEPAVHVPIQIIDSSFGTRPGQCGNADTSPADAGLTESWGWGFLPRTVVRFVRSPPIITFITPASDRIVWAPRSPYSYKSRIRWRSSPRTITVSWCNSPLFLLLGLPRSTAPSSWASAPRLTTYRREYPSTISTRMLRA